MTVWFQKVTIEQEKQRKAEKVLLYIEDQDISEEDYQLLLEKALDKCNRFAFVQRRDMMENEKVAMKSFYKLIEPIKDSLIEMKEQMEWETTELLESTAYVFYFELNDKTKEFLLNKSNSLFGWITPNLPEDLMLYKNEQIWVAGCSHENWFIVHDEFESYEEFIGFLRES